MKTSQLSRIILAVIIMLIFQGCPEKEITNPFDEGCPKELFTPADFKTELQGTSVKLSWAQSNKNINGFVINRKENDGAYNEAARVDKSVTNWTDTKLQGGVKYGYQLFAYAGANLSNPLLSELTTPSFGPSLTTAAATGMTSTTAVLGGNVTADGGSSVTERGICYATTQNPTVTNSKVSMGNGIGAFSNTVTGLSNNTTYYVRAYATNTNGTSYGNEISFKTTQISVATVITQTATNLSVTGATVGGDVQGDGGATVTERGICYALTQNPTTANSKITSGSGTGSFNAAISGLTANTTYYARAYAINSQGTAYGNEINFKTTQISVATVTTAVANNVTGSSAVLGGNVTSDGNATVTEYGVCYSTSQNPTTASTKVPIGSGTGAFSKTVTGLTGNTTYYVKAYAINSQGTAYGAQITVTTVVPVNLASLATSGATNPTMDGAVVGGNITDEGGGTVTERGVCYNTSGLPTTGHTKVALGSGLGTFSTTLTGLTSNTTYYVRAYAINSAGTAYGSQISFTTLGSTPTVSTKDVTNTLETTAVAGGIVSSDGGASVTERGICYGTAQNPTIYDSKVASGSGTGGFNVPLNILVPNTTYYTRAYATNKNGTAYGENKSFKTADAYYAGFENGMPAGWTGMWTVSTDSPYEGFFCLKSTNVNDSIVFTLNVTKSDGGQIKFYHKSTAIYWSWETVNTQFYIDNVLQSTFTNEDWTLKTFSISPGTHKIKFRNNGGLSGGQPVTYIDYVICPR